MDYRAEAEKIYEALKGNFKKDAEINKEETIKDIMTMLEYKDEEKKELPKNGKISFTIDYGGNNDDEDDTTNGEDK